MEKDLFQIQMEVRDYECDHQGIVNNAVYNNYFEHARHKFLIDNGIDFNSLINEKILLVLYRSEIDYFVPLKPQNSFIITVKYENITNVRGVFTQEIILLESNHKATMFKGYVTAVNEKRKPIKLKSIGL